ncbi:hypothetical protein PPS11_25165 [Pseudomonas putida S11]|nr:hypothetical protein PPS11_25165 [Pseudomonas putida S11]
MQLRLQPVLTLSTTVFSAVRSTCLRAISGGQRRAVADQFQRDQLAQGVLDIAAGKLLAKALHQLLGRAALLARGCR